MIDDYMNESDLYDYGDNIDEVSSYEEKDKSQLLTEIARLEEEINDKDIIISQMEDKINKLEKKLQLSKAPAHRDDIDIQRICELFRDGFSQSRIAKELGCSRGTVKIRLMECELLK